MRLENKAYGFLCKLEEKNKAANKQQNHFSHHSICDEQKPFMAASNFAE